MQITFWPRWLMIVSTATAVLPVWRSPMMSSRWPRPMGTMPSIAFRPVCSGSFTGLRSTTPGASRSIGMNCFEAIGPLPSIAWPSAFTTRPIISSPTGTEMMRPVRLTMSPSLISVEWPRSTAPTLSSSRLSAMPKMPCGNSSISPAIARSTPLTRAMPSPTDMTVPISATSTSAAKLPIWSRMILEISSALICMCVSACCLPFLNQPLLQPLELSRHAAVEHHAADARDDAADDGRVDARVHRHRQARRPGDRALKRRALAVAERRGRHDLRRDDPFSRAHLLAEGLRQIREQLDPAVLRQQLDGSRHVGAHVAGRLEHGRDDRLLLCGRHGRGGEDPAQLGAAGHECVHCGQVARRALGLALLRDGFEERGRVTLAGGPRRHERSSGWVRRQLLDERVSNVTGSYTGWATTYRVKRQFIPFGARTGQGSRPVQSRRRRAPPGSDRSTRPTTEVMTPASVSLPSTCAVAPGSTARKSPPDVCGSNATRRMAGVTLGPIRTRGPKCAAFVLLPPGVLASASATAPSRSGSAVVSIAIVTPLAAAIPAACPTSPKPVMSVALLTIPTGSCRTTLAASRLSRVIESV